MLLRPPTVSWDEELPFGKETTFISITWYVCTVLRTYYSARDGTLENVIVIVCSPSCYPIVLTTHNAHFLFFRPFITVQLLVSESTRETTSLSPTVWFTPMHGGVLVPNRPLSLPNRYILIPTKIPKCSCCETRFTTI